MRELRLDHADVLLLGLWNRAVPDGVLKAAVRLKERGVIRYIAVSAHERTAFGIAVPGPKMAAARCVG